MVKEYQSKNIGEVHTTNDELGSYELTVIDGGTKVNYCTVQIEDWISEVTYSNIKKGKIKYPYHPSVHDKGYIGVGVYNLKTHKTLYAAWRSMIERAYSPKFHERCPTYKDVTVCNSWLNFQTFAEWMETSNYQKGFQLDKDLLLKGNKVYSPETCIFIPKSLNLFLTNAKLNNTSGYTGVSWDKTRNKWKAEIRINGKNKYLGLFTTVEEASAAYITARVVEAKKLKELYVDVLPIEAIESIR